MKNHIPVSIILISSVLILFFNSCTPESCFEDTESFLNATFYDYDLKEALAPDSLTIYGLNMETNKLYDKSQNVQPAIIPLNVAAESCIYIIEINGITDTLEFIYNSYPHLISQECGFTFYHNLDTAIHTINAIDSIFKSQSNITTINEENIRIFY